MRRLLPLVLFACAPEGDGVVPDPVSSCLDMDADGTCDHDVTDWSEDAEIEPGTHRGNVYDLDPDDLVEAWRAGVGHASDWPVDVSGLLLPMKPLEAFLTDDPPTPEHATMLSLARNTLGFGTLDEMVEWVGVAQVSEPTGAAHDIPLPDSLQPGDYFGLSRVDTEWGEALSFSCGTCHAGRLLGRTVFGLTNREERANSFFHVATLFFPGIPAESFADLTGATDAEIELFERTQRNLPAVGVKPPEVLGLDTALAQVGLSLARRDQDGWATRNPQLEVSPRPSPLQTFVADSKPAVWWTARYKTRWLSDGSIVSGNPIFTNFLWNELGRATDLVELDGWLEANQDAMDELTVAVFAAEAPRWTDWFGADSHDLEAAQRGQVHFDAMCADCHGTYEKGWDAGDADTRGPAELAETTRVVYHRRTPVIDVGTDPQRHEGMASFTQGLNDLEISHRFGTVVEVQQGYVPPPLDGIWARYPYLHNQSVPTLCDLLLPVDERPTEFWVGPSEDPETDFDADCVGYPVGEAVPEAWKDDERRMDVSREGLSNMGHDAMLLVDGEPVLDAAGRADLVAYLKTL